VSTTEGGSVFVPRKVVLALVAVAALVFAFTAYGGSREDGNGETLVSSSLAPSVPTDPAFHGIAPGGVPWVLASGSVRLKTDGELDVRIRGLVIPALGTAGPVTTVSASLLCGADAQAGPTATSGAVPLSASGNARIETTLTLPASCLAPIVVVHPNGGVARYIAVSGWKS
jgi:hypothetical protein